MKKEKNTSLSEINQSITVPKNASFFKTLLAFSGPGSLVAVGYMDPGNWVTSVVGGAKFHYLLLAIVLISSLMAMQLQQMAGKLGIVTGLDLAQATAQHTKRPIRYLLWIMLELALMATDLAEVIGSAIALHLLFGWSLFFSVSITILDVFLLLLMIRFGFRKIEAFVATLILTILLIFAYLVLLSKPDISDMMVGFIPKPQTIGFHVKHGSEILTLALGIIGATVMPHNLYLHSSISQTRKIDYTDPDSIKRNVRFMTWDSNIQLFFAFIINSLLLILGASLFFGHGDRIQALSDMYTALKDQQIAGLIASPFLSTLFAIALLASGQNSTITGTLTGQIVMEGFLHIKLPQWLIRLMTRILVIIPVLIITFIYGSKEETLDQLLVYSQVFLSIALPFSIFPLIYFTSQKKLMGKFVNHSLNTWIAYGVAIILTVLNIQLIIGLF